LNIQPARITHANDAMLPLTYRSNLMFLTHYEDKKNGAKCRNRGSLGVRGHSRSSAMSPFDRAHITSYSTSIEPVRQSWCRFRDIVSYLSKVADFNHPTCICPPPEVDPAEFHGEFWRQKTRVCALLSGTVKMMLRPAVLVELRLGTDRHTRTVANIALAYSVAR